jgi:oligoendopeptidase F
MHSYYSTEEQPYIYSDYTIFQAEVASTTNEALLIRHLLNNVEQDKFRKHVLSHALENFRGTLFRQTMFSEFEEWLHREVEEGEALSHLKLDEKYGELKDRYYSNVELDDRIIKEWMKIPHFYYNFYVYQYATGISAGTVLADKIVNNGPGNYKNFLKKGGSEYSIESLKEAGVEIDSSEPIDKAMSKFEGYLEELNTVG